jgi:iron complex outermembrane receptor protein
LAGWTTSANLSRYWIASQDVRTSRDYLTGLTNGAGTQTKQNRPGWWTGDTTIERTFGAQTVALGVNSNLYETSQDSFTTAQWKEATASVYSASTWGKTSLWGLWAEDRLALNDDFELTMGVRYDQWRAFDAGIGKQLSGRRIDSAYASRTDSSVSPKLSLQGRIPGDIDLQISLGSAVRFPTVGELFQGRIDDVTRQIDPQSFDPNLKPERSKDANLILRRSFGKVRATGSLFYQDIDDAIFSFNGLNQFGTVISSYKNVDQVRQVGAELILEGTDILIDGLNIDANAAWIDAKTVKNRANPAAEGAAFPRIPEWRSNGNLRYRLSEALKLSLGWRYASRPNSDLFGLVRGDGYGFQSEYFTVDSRLSWDVTPKVQANVGVDNLFNDQAYVAHPLPQRTLVIDLKAKW